MKKIFGKNQVIITALAIMIAVAGYLSLTQDKAKDVSKMIEAENADDKNDGSKDGTEQISADKIIQNGQNADENNTDDLTAAGEDGQQTSADDVQIIYDISDEDIVDAESYNLTDNGEIDTGKDTSGEAVLVSGTISAGYFDSAKLSREQTRSKNKEILMELVNSATTSDAQKEQAISEVIELTSASEKETASETMLEAKGFGQSVVSIVDGKVDVIVNAASLTEKDIAQIEDIIKRKTGAEAEDIVITPVGVE